MLDHHIPHFIMHKWPSIGSIHLKVPRFARPALSWFQQKCLDEFMVSIS